MHNKLPDNTLNHTDLTFFTNEKGHSLLDRFKRTLKDTQYFDVLVGYFRSSGFYQLYDSIEPIDKVRMLVGLGIDNESYRMIKEFRDQTVMDFESHAATKKEFQITLISEVENSNDQTTPQTRRGAPCGYPGSRQIT